MADNPPFGLLETFPDPFFQPWPGLPTLPVKLNPSLLNNADIPPGPPRDDIVVIQTVGRPPILPPKVAALIGGIPVNDPPFNHQGREPWLANILAAWQPPDPPPRQKGPLNPALTSVNVDNPPVNRSGDFWAVRSWWYPPQPPLPQTLILQPQEGPAPTPPTGEPGANPGGGTAGYFSRKKWHDLKALIEAKQAAQYKADELKRSAARAKLAEASRVTADVVVGIESGEGMPDIERLTSLLEGAARAQRLVDILSKAKQAVREAQRIKDEMDEEEEAIAFLLLN